LSEALDRILAYHGAGHGAGQGAGSTLSGCLIRLEAGAALICREPDACEGMKLLNPGTSLWDRRWSVTVGGDWPAAAYLGALGERGLAELRANTESGTRNASDSWASAPRLVRQTTPGIWLGDGTVATILLAAPTASYLNRQIVGPECTVTAENVALGELP